MTTNNGTGETTELRRCSGSTRFGIEPHEASIDEFPTQPSRKDGLGRMCQEHWRAYTSGLRKDALARKAGEAKEDEASPEPTTHRKKKRATTPKPSANASEVERAEALIGEVDAMPAGQMVTRVGDADVQAALETSTAARMLAD